MTIQTLLESFRASPLGYELRDTLQYKKISQLVENFLGKMLRAIAEGRDVVHDADEWIAMAYRVYGKASEQLELLYEQNM